MGKQEDMEDRGIHTITSNGLLPHFLLHYLPALADITIGLSMLPVVHGASDTLVRIGVGKGRRKHNTSFKLSGLSVHQCGILHICF